MKANKIDSTQNSHSPFLEIPNTINSSSSLTVSPSSTGSKLTPHEIEVLKQSSVINGRTFLPWLDVDLSERFSYPEMFTDPDGLLALSAKQIQKLGGWKRPSQLMAAPRMVYLISSTSIIQDVVTDCSFVASLCVSAAYERKFRKQVGNIPIFPYSFFFEITLLNCIEINFFHWPLLFPYKKLFIVNYVLHLASK